MKARLLALAVVATLVALPALAQSKLVLYTSQPDKDAQQTVEAFRKQNPGVAVEVFRSGTTEVLNKLLAEFVAGAPAADVLLIADAVSMERLKADNRLEAYKTADVSQFPAGAYDSDKTYFGTKLITTGIVVNKAATMKPKTWSDLLRSEAKGQVVLPSPLYSGAAAIHMAALSSAPGIGAGYYDSLAKNGATPVRGNGPVATAVAGGQKMYGIIVEYMALNAQAKGSPVEFVFPADGVSAVTEPVAMLKSSKNPAASRAFIDFILSRPGQELAVTQGYLPARKDVTPPAGFPNVADLKILPLNVSETLKNDEANKKRFADLFGG